MIILLGIYRVGLRRIFIFVMAYGYRRRTGYGPARRVARYRRSVSRRRAVGYAARRGRSRFARPMRLFTRPTPTAATNVFRLLQGPSGLFPATAVVKLRYASQMVMSHTAGVGNSFKMITNSAYGPEYGGGGHQPRYFDQLVGAQLYQQYWVVGCKYTIIAPAGTGVNEFILVNASLSTAIAATSQAAVIQSSELPFSQITNSTPGAHTKISGYVDNAKVAGKTRQEYLSDPAWGSSYNSAPTNQVYLTVGSAPSDNTTGSDNDSYYAVTLEMDCVLTSRWAIASS